MARKKKPSPNQIQIKQGKTYQEIARTYMNFIGIGFDLTIDEMAEYLSCSYDFVQRKIAPDIEHIVVNTTARKALLEEEGGDSPYISLFYKRLLFYRDDFHQYLRKNCTIVTEFEPYYYEDLSEVAGYNLAVLSESTGIKAEYLYRWIAKYPLKEETEKEYLRSYDRIVEALEEIPDCLRSAKDLPFGYTSQAYKHIRDNAIKKTKLFSLVRYRPEDLRIKRKAVFSLPLKYDKYKVLDWVEEELKEVEVPDWMKEELENRADK